MPQLSPMDLSIHSLTYNTHLHIHIQGPRSNPNIMSALSAFFLAAAKTKVLTLEKLSGVSVQTDFCVCVRERARVSRNYSRSVKWFKIVILGSQNHRSMFN